MILDKFANRCGEDTWVARMSKDAVKTIRKALLRNATRQMSVACFRTYRNRMELLWIAGSRKRYGPGGVIPVGTTQSSKFSFRQMDSFESLPAMRPIVCLAALLHDIGKTNNEFQRMLRSVVKGKRQSDSFRHEWFSALIFTAFVKKCGSDDAQWLSMLERENGFLLNLPADILALGERPFQNLPRVALFLVWLILSHHRLPSLSPFNPEALDVVKFDLYDESKLDIQSIMSLVKTSWGYQKDADAKGYDKLSFSLSRLEASPLYWNQVQLDARRLEKHLPLLQNMPKESFHIFLQIARMALMLGDYNYSAKKPPEDAPPQQPFIDEELYANLRPYRALPNAEKCDVFHQTVAEHLLGVREEALKSLMMCYFVNKGARVEDNIALRKPSKAKFHWQDRASSLFGAACDKEAEENGLRPASFIVNMASTGYGKTIGNAKIERELSEDHSLRYSILFGLRTLTLQTGDAYRDMLHLEDEDYAVMIGSRAIQDLHDQELLEQEADMEDMDREEDFLIASAMKYPSWMDPAVIEETLEEELEQKETEGKPKDEPSPDLDSPIAVLFRGSPERSRKSRAFIETPILVATIDYMMPATECISGSRYLLPLIRMMSSDLIIDEIDDFTGSDLLAISRLVHLAGMYGRNVILSSATMPPGIVRGMAKAYLQGYEVCQSFFQTKRRVQIGWCDEFHQDKLLLSPDAATDYLDDVQKQHEKFVEQRVKALLKEPVRRWGKVYEIPDEILQMPGRSGRLERYEQCYLDAALQLHEYNCNVDEKTGKRYSIGVIRVAHIDFCVALSLFLLKEPCPDDVELRILPYHSNQTVLLRQQEESYLDRVLKRKFEGGKVTDTIKDPHMRKILERSSAANIVFIVVATPVEEVGRDHNFDWAVIEPSSERSIIQLAGRILRHREVFCLTHPNVYVMQYNLKAFKAFFQPKKEGWKEPPVFLCPGFESEEDAWGSEHLLEKHNMLDLLPKESLERIDSIPRIQHPQVLHEEKYLIDLEHAVADELADGGKYLIGQISGWTSSDSCLFMTGLVQRLYAFRKSERQLDVWLRHIPNESGRYHLVPKNPKEYLAKGFQGARMEVETFDHDRLWLVRDYQVAIQAQIERKTRPDDLQPSEPTDDDYFAMEEKNGMFTISFPDRLCYYSDNLGFYRKLESF